MGTHLQCGDNLVAIVLGGDGIPHHSIRVDDCVSLLPADNDGPLTSSSAVELLRMALDGDGGVGVGGDHGWDWGGEKLVWGRGMCLCRGPAPTSPPGRAPQPHAKG